MKLNFSLLVYFMIQSLQILKYLVLTKQYFVFKEKSNPAFFYTYRLIIFFHFNVHQDWYNFGIYFFFTLLLSFAFTFPVDHARESGRSYLVYPVYFICSLNRYDLWSCENLILAFVCLLIYNTLFSQKQITQLLLRWLIFC